MGNESINERCFEFGGFGKCMSVVRVWERGHEWIVWWIPLQVDNQSAQLCWFEFTSQRVAGFRYQFSAFDYEDRQFINVHFLFIAFCIQFLKCAAVLNTSIMYSENRVIYKHIDGNYFLFIYLESTETATMALPPPTAAVAVDRFRNWCAAIYHFPE